MTSTDDWTYCGKCKLNLRTRVRRTDGSLDAVCIRCDFPERLPIATKAQLTEETPD